MRILFLTPWYPDREKPNHGVFVRDQVRALAEVHDVWVISAKVNYKSFSISHISVSQGITGNVTETRLVVKKSLPVFNQLNFFYLILRETKKIVQTFKPHIIHGNIGYVGGVWSMLISKKCTLPYVITEHTRLRNNFRSFAHRQLTVKAIRSANAIVSVSRWHAQEIEDETGVHPIVIPNVIDFSKYPSVTERPESTTLHIGFLGGLDTDVKGLDVLLKACTQLTVPFFLHIGGGGSLLTRYQETAQSLHLDSKCKFYGSIANENVFNFMSKLHLFVSSSRSETFGVAMVEAIACGLPVVATDSGGPSEFISEENGLIVKNEDPDALASGIITVWRTYDKYVPQIVRDTVIDRFSKGEFLQKISRVYSTLLSNSR